MSAKHPVEQFQLNSLPSGAAGITEHVKLSSVPTKYSKTLEAPATGLPSGLPTMVTLYETRDNQKHIL